MTMRLRQDRTRNETSRRCLPVVVWAILLACIALIASPAWAVGCEGYSLFATMDCTDPIEQPWSYTSSEMVGGPYYSEAEAVGSAVQHLESHYPNACNFVVDNPAAPYGDAYDYVWPNGFILGQNRHPGWTFVVYNIDWQGHCSPSTTLGLQLGRRRDLTCPLGYTFYSAGTGSTVCVATRQTPQPCPCVGNPIAMTSGGKVQREVDYQYGGTLPLRFERVYNSRGFNPPLGTGQATMPLSRVWRHNYQRSVFSDPVDPQSRVVVRPDQLPEYFVRSGLGYTNTRKVGDGGTLRNGAGGGYVYVGTDDTTEFFDAAGRLTSLVTRAGLTQSFAYNGNGRLQSASDSFGRQLAFAYDDTGHLIQVTAPGGGVYTLTWEVWPYDNLLSMQYPGSASRIYVYTPGAWTSQLLSITDENGVVTSRFGYDRSGKASSTQRAGGVELYTLTYNSNQQTTMKDPIGNIRTVALGTVGGVLRAFGSSQPCPTCNGLNYSTSTFDANGNRNSVTDFNGRKSCFVFDPIRNLETARVDGILSAENCATVLATPPSRPDVRKVTTQLHPLWRVAAKVAEPQRLTTSVYNGDVVSSSPVYCAPVGATIDGTPIGVLCSRTVQATTDLTGAQGMAVATTGMPRTWSYTYDANGQVVTATDPNSRITTTTYYAATDPDVGKRGNPASITNAAGHVTRFTAYDADGRPLAETDANGAVTTYTYHPRGWLTSRRVAGETTTYDYDPAGQLIKVTVPDGSFITYTYDGAHRLTQLSDGLGNRIVYTLDALGNRVKEEAYDSANQLARLRQQVFDNLGRLHQNVGAQ